MRWKRVGVLDQLFSRAKGLKLLRKLVGLDMREGWTPDPMVALPSAVLEDDAAIVHDVANRLKMSNDERYRLNWAVQHDAPLWGGITEQEVRTALYHAGQQTIRDRLMLEWAGDGTADWSEVLTLVDAWQRPTMPVSGADLLKQGLAEGPAIGDSLRKLETRKPHPQRHPRARPEDLAFHQPARPSSSPRMTALDEAPAPPTVSSSGSTRGSCFPSAGSAIATKKDPRVKPEDDGGGPLNPAESRQTGHASNTCVTGASAKSQCGICRHPSPPHHSQRISPHHLRKAGSRDVQRRGGDVIERCSPSECAVSSGQRGERVRIAVGNGCDCGHRGPGQNSPALRKTSAGQLADNDHWGRGETASLYLPVAAIARTPISGASPRPRPPLP
jgi:hypothetical protein